MISPPVQVPFLFQFCREKMLPVPSERQARVADSGKSWSVDASEIDVATWDLSVKNPNVEEEVPLRAPEDIMAEIRELGAESEGILAGIGELVK